MNLAFPDRDKEEFATAAAPFDNEIVVFTNLGNVYSLKRKLNGWILDTLYERMPAHPPGYQRPVAPPRGPGDA